MAVTFVVGNTIMIVLDEENMERIQQNDPFELDMRKMGTRKMGTVALPIPFHIVVCYARKDELPKLQGFIQAKDYEGLLKHLARGFKVTASDHDRGYERYEKLEGS